MVAPFPAAPDPFDLFCCEQSKDGDTKGSMGLIQRKTEGDVDVSEDTEIRGVVAGAVSVRPNVSLQLFGMVGGGLTLEKGGRVELRGTVLGDIVNHGGVLEVYGMVNGDIITSESGKTTIDKDAVVHGDIREQ
jgi:hypothetical protein